jgi:hypothetical protein
MISPILYRRNGENILMKPFRTPNAHDLMAGLHVRKVIRLQKIRR